MNGTARGGVPSSILPSSLPAEAEGSRNGNDAPRLPPVPPGGEGGDRFSTGGMLLLLSFVAIHGGTSDVWRLCIYEDMLFSAGAYLLLGSVSILRSAFTST